MNKEQYQRLLEAVKVSSSEVERIRARFKYAYPFSDSVFKVLMANSQKQERTISFINAMLGLQGDKAIREFSLQSQEFPGIFGQKTSVFDINGITNAGERVVVEMQENYTSYFMDRLLFYTSRLVTSCLKRGDGYKLPQIYVLTLLNKEMFHDTEKHYFNKCMLMCHGKSVYDKLSINIVEVEKFFRLEDEGVTNEDFSPRANWLRAFRNIILEKDVPSNFDDEIFKDLLCDASLVKFTDEHLILEVDTMTDLIYERQCAREEGLAEGRKEGRAEGREEGRKEGRAEVRAEAYAKARKMAKGLLADGVPMEIIVKHSGLTPEEIKAL